VSIVSRLQLVTAGYQIKCCMQRLSAERAQMPFNQ
jgi:hypothetical protein